jgi:hypothetical protein
VIIWRNEAYPEALHEDSAGITKEPPPGTVEITRAEERNGNYHIWYAPVPAVPAGETPEPLGMLTAMAGMHHEWFEAWQAAGFSEDQAYGLVAGIVQAAFSSG